MVTTSCACTMHAAPLIKGNRLCLWQQILPPLCMLFRQTVHFLASPTTFMNDIMPLMSHPPITNIVLNGPKWSLSDSKSSSSGWNSWQLSQPICQCGHLLVSLYLREGYAIQFRHCLPHFNQVLPTRIGCQEIVFWAGNSFPVGERSLRGNGSFTEGIWLLELVFSNAKEQWWFKPNLVVCFC